MSARDPFLVTDADYRLQELAAYADAQRDADLLDQVADSTEERDNVRRILGAETRQPGMRNLNAPRIESGQLSERDLDAAQRWRDQPDLERDPPRAGDLLRVVALFLAAWASIATTLLVINT